MRTLLGIIQEMCRRSGVTVPRAVISNTDDQVIQMMSLLNEGIEELESKYKWPPLVKEATFVSTGYDNQGNLETIAPGFMEMIPNTFWSLTNRIPLNGSVSAADAQNLKIWGRPSALINFRAVANQLHLLPAPAAGESFRFEYRSKYLVIDGVTGLPKPYFTLDTDTTVLPDELHLMDLRWRWKCEKGLPYAENFRMFETRCLQAAAAAAAAVPLSMSGVLRNAMPGVIVPIGSWNK